MQTFNACSKTNERPKQNACKNQTKTAEKPMVKRRTQ